MALKHSKYVRGPLRIPHAEKAGEVIAVRYEHQYLPANMTVRHIVADADDVDGGTDFEWDLGLMSGKVGEALQDDGDPRTCGAEFFSGATLGRDVGVATPTLKTAYRVAPVAYDRSIGVKFVDQGTTTGKLGFTVFFGT
jgi:hypothetical protein